MVDKQREDIGNTLSKDYFPFTHGDNVEREREAMRSQLREEYLAARSTSALVCEGP
jgi:L-lactate utilization protein LutB